jgi:hypothetical protein
MRLAAVGAVRITVEERSPATSDVSLCACVSATAVAASLHAVPVRAGHSMAKGHDALRAHLQQELSVSLTARQLRRHQRADKDMPAEGCEHAVAALLPSSSPSDRLSLAPLFACSTALTCALVVHVRSAI